nr:permease [Kosmotoga sp. DU53]
MRNILPMIITKFSNPRIKVEFKKFSLLVGGFLLFYLLPFENSNVQQAILGGFTMLSSYAKEHVLFCLIPAFFVAGTITVFVKKSAILRVLGPQAKKIIAYPVAASAGGILAVCSCTILPLFGGIYKRGAGLGPAIAFLFTGPAINVAAIFLTGRVLGWELSIIRLVATISSAIVIGLIMQAIFAEKGEGGFTIVEDEPELSWAQILVFLGLQFVFLIAGGLKINVIIKTTIMVIAALGIILMALNFKPSYSARWIEETWEFTKKILPYLFFGVFIAGIISHSLPKTVVQTFLGGNRLFSNFFASIFGAFMYFATLTEVPIIQSLMELGMGKGPALALFMAGYTLSLPSMIVLTKLLGKKKAFTYFALVIVFSTFWGYLYGNLMK